MVKISRRDERDQLAEGILALERMESGASRGPGREPEQASEEGGVRTAVRFLNATGLYGTLNEIEDQVAVGEWGVAEQDTRTLAEQARHEKSVPGEAQIWRSLVEHVDNLLIAIRAKDQGGCIGELAALHSLIEKIAACQGE